MLEETILTVVDTLTVIQLVLTIHYMIYNQLSKYSFTSTNLSLVLTVASISPHLLQTKYIYRPILQGLSVHHAGHKHDSLPCHSVECVHEHIAQKATWPSDWLGCILADGEVCLGWNGERSGMAWGRS